MTALCHHRLIRENSIVGIPWEGVAEYGSLAEVTVGLEAPRFNITIELDGTEMLNCDRCRWDRIETPASAEDLIAKRFPFTATDLTTLTP